MSKNKFQAIAFTAASVLASVAVVSALSTSQAQAAVLTYESELTITAVTPALPVSIANATVTFLKAPSAVQPGLFDYTLQSFTGSFLSTTYSLANTLTPTNVALAQSLSVFLPSAYQAKYQTLLLNVVNGTVPTYTGDGDFPPAAPIAYAFSSQDVSKGVSSVAPFLSTEQLSLVNTIAALFPAGGEATFSSTLFASASSTGGAAAGAPEPTTMAGLALAGAGLAAARRRLNKRQKAA
jgi:hypothetical protein